jgi:general secretion pathway protein A
MYESFFHLRKKPFELVPNPDFLYASRTHHKAGMYLDYALAENTGFILLTGEVGSGKTTLIRSLLKKLGPDIQVSKIFNTHLTNDQMIETINDDFGLETAGKNKVQLLRELYEFLIRQYGDGRKSVLIIDEAQNLSIDALEELRMLSNLETSDSKLLQIILVGQPELRQILALPELRQLRQRISIHCHLQPLTRAETEEYFLYRLEVAGDRNAVTFTPEAFDLIYGSSAGIPRLINIIGDFLLLAAFSEETRTINADLVQDVISDPQFEGQFFPANFSPQPAASVAAPNPPATAPTGQLSGVSAEVKMPIERTSAISSPADIERIHRRLNDFENSLRDVCRSLGDRNRGLQDESGLFSLPRSRMPGIHEPTELSVSPSPSTWTAIRKFFSREFL